LIHTNGNNFIGIAIQYRLGAFGWLSSDEVNRFGVVNAGLHDRKTFPLKMVAFCFELFFLGSRMVRLLHFEEIKRQN